MSKKYTKGFAKIGMPEWELDRRDSILEKKKERERDKHRETQMKLRQEMSKHFS